MRRSTSNGTLERWNGGTWSSATFLAAICLSIFPSFRLSVFDLSAQEIATNAGALFLLFPVGAQAVAMGQTAAALEGRGEAAFWNPAGLATIDHAELAFNTASLAAGATHALTAYFPSHGFGVLGGALYLVDYGDLERTDSANNTIARVAPRNIEFLASYATELAGSVTLGINYKLVEFVVDCSGDCTNFPNGHGVTHALDIGGQFAVGRAGALRVGVAVRNVGFKLQVNNRELADPLPARLVVGAAYRVLLPGGSGLGGGEDRLDLKVAADGQAPDPAAPPPAPLPPRHARLWVRPAASLLLPGSGQLLARQDRGTVYLAVELYSVARIIQLTHAGRRDADRFRELAFDVARRGFTAVPRDTVFEYYKTMQRFTESGQFDRGPGPAFAPETDTATFNGSVWLLARRTFWSDPGTPPDPMSPEYLRAVQFYQQHAVGPGFLWSWRNKPLEQGVFRETIHRSDDAFRTAQNVVGVLLANHVASAVDALISSRLSAAAGRRTALHMTLGPVTAVRLSVEF